MMDPARVKALFQRAIEIDDPDGRRAFLDREAGVSGALRARLDDLLNAFAHPSEALGSVLRAELEPQATVFESGPVAPAPEPPATVDLTDDRARTDLDPNPDPDATAAMADRPHARSAGAVPPTDSLIAGRYKVRQEIGEGGMGSVYLAEQVQPVRRQVALKLIKPGMDSRLVLARFESERQALALMDHPHIAKVLDAGTTDDGRPFFVMELVKGIPLTDYCDQHRADLATRLLLFRQICSAVQHAHQKGIIHRDLKPTNVLVESHDGKPVPKVIDFGLAKATSGVSLSEHSLYTAFGGIAGTPLYMAPEQATFNAIDVDTRADVYALGVILYELLTGSTPIPREALKKAALDEMLRVIREEEPPTPSSRVSTSEALPSLAANRQVEPTRLSRFVRGDLDWIVMKALAKERSRRYDSAIGLANDVERFLNHEPVSAGPPTAGYRLRKFVRRHRGQVAAACLVLLALVAGVIGTTWGLVEARRQEVEAKRQERIAIARSEEAEQAHQAETAQRLTAEKRLGQVSRMNEVLGSIFGDLDPKQVAESGKPLSAVLGERLDSAMAAIEGESVGDPLAVARMQEILGRSQDGLGYPEKAIGLLSTARATFTAQLGPDHPETLDCTNNLAACLIGNKRFDEARELLEAVLVTRRSKLGPHHRSTLTTMNNLAFCLEGARQLDEALKLREEVLAASRSTLGDDHRETLTAMNNLALAYQRSRRFDEALKLREEVLAARRSKFGDNHPDTITAMSNLSESYNALGRRDDLIKLAEEAVTASRSTFGPDHPRTITVMNTLVYRYNDAYRPDNPGRVDDAVRLGKEALAASRSRLGLDDPLTLDVLKNLTNSYTLGRRDDDLRKLKEEALAESRSRHGPNHPLTIEFLQDLSKLNAAAGRVDAAYTMKAEALAALRSQPGPDHVQTIAALGDLALLAARVGHNDEALKLGAEAMAAVREKLPKNSREKDEALKPGDEAMTAVRAKLLKNSREANPILQSLQQTFLAVERIDLAIEPCEARWKLYEAIAGPEHRSSLECLLQLTTLLARDGHHDERAAERCDALIKLSGKTLGADHGMTILARHMRAMLDLRLGRTEAAGATYAELADRAAALLKAGQPTMYQQLAGFSSVDRHPNDSEACLVLLEALTRSLREALGPERMEALMSATNLAETYQYTGRFDRAVTLHRELVPLWRKVEGEKSWRHALALSSLGWALNQHEQYADAESVLREAVALYAEKYSDAWDRSNAEVLLGWALLGLDRPDAAEPLLRAGYEGMKQRIKNVYPRWKRRMSEDLDRLIQVNESLGRTDEVERWRKEKASAFTNVHPQSQAIP